MSMFIGEALVGEGNEIAHIDLLIGDKDGPVGHAFANALARQSEGHNNLLAVLTPNLAVKPATVMITKVTIKGMRQAVQMFGPAQAAVAKAVADSVADSVLTRKQAEDYVIVCGVVFHALEMAITFVTTTSHGTWLPGNLRGYVRKGVILPGDAMLLELSRRRLK